MEGKFLNSHIDFKFIRNCYPLHEKLFCYFQCPNVSLWQPEIGDWVGLFKVGWATLKEFKIRKMIQGDLLEARKNVNVEYVHVVFEQHELPKDIEGLYQFVYVSKNEIVRGISTTFRFERVLPHGELRRMVDVMYKPEVCGEVTKPIQKESIVGRIEGELMKEFQRLNLNWGKLADEVNFGQLIQKYINVINADQKDEEIIRKLEELLIENGKLCISLRSRIQEVTDLKKECDEIKCLNTDLLTKLSVAERKVEQLERIREQNIRRMEELTVRETPRVGCESLPIKYSNEEIPRWVLPEEQERVQPELRRATSFCNELETPIETRVKVVQTLEEPLQRRGQLIERILREVDGTPSQVRLLKRFIEDLKNDNEILRERVRQTEIETVKPEVPVTKSIIKEVTVCPRINLLPMELVGGLHGEKTVESTLPSISVSTMLPEVPTTTTTTRLTITGKINNVEQQPQIQHQQPKLVPQQQHWTQPKHWQTQPQHELRGQVGEYLHKLDEQIRTKIEEKLRTKLQEQSCGKVELQQTKPIQRVEELIRQKMEQHLQQQPTQQWSSLPVTTEEVLPKWRLHHQQQQQPIDCEYTKRMTTTTEVPSIIPTPTLQQVLSTMCPVCGIAMPNELNVCDFEIHVNSHFTD